MIKDIRVYIGDFRWKMQLCANKLDKKSCHDGIISDHKLLCGAYGNMGCGVFKRGHKIRKTKNQQPSAVFF